MVDVRNSSARYQSFCRQAHNREVDDRVCDHRRGAAGLFSERKERKKKQRGNDSALEYLLLTTDRLIWLRIRLGEIKRTIMDAPNRAYACDCRAYMRDRIRATRLALPALRYEIRERFRVAACTESHFLAAANRKSTRHNKCIPRGILQEFK